MATEKSEQQPGTSRHFSFVTVQPVNTVVLRPLNFCGRDRSSSRQVLRRSASQDSSRELGGSHTPFLSHASMEAGPPSTSSSVTSTPTMVRSRPRIPAQLLPARAAPERDHDTVTGLMRTDWSKYRRKSRQFQSQGGHHGSPVSTQSLPTTPKLSPILSPESLKSPPPELATTGLTLTRMGCIRSKLEKLKENQDSPQDSACLPPKPPSSPVVTPARERGKSLSANTLTVTPGPEIFLKRRCSGEPNGHVCSVTRGAAVPSRPSLRAHHSDSAIPCHTGGDHIESYDSVPDGSVGSSSSPETAKFQRPFIEVGDAARPEPGAAESEITFVTISGDGRNKSGDRQTRLATLHPARSTDSEASYTSIHLRPASSIDKDSDDASLHVTEDEDSGSHEGHRDRSRRWLKDSSIETEDEGFGGLDMEGGYKDYPTPAPAVLTVAHTRPAVPLVTYRSPLSLDSSPPKSPVSIPKIMVQPRAGEEDIPGSSSEACQHHHREPDTNVVVSSSGKAPTSRFLTHPPIRDRSTSRESGSVDSNGLGSLREGVEPGRQGELDSAATASVVSLADSHICPSEASDAPRYHDVVQDVLAGTKDIDKNFERKNSKSLKQKSKSDPSGEKQRESVDIPTFINSTTQATSSPVLPEECDNVSQLREFRKTESDNRKTKSDDVLTANDSKASSRISKLQRESQRESRMSEDSSEDASDVATPKPSKRSSKKRQRDRTKSVSKQSSVDGKANKSVTIDSAAKHDAPETKHKDKKRKALKETGKSATAPCTPQSLSPENTLDKHAKDQVSLTLPLSKKSALTRSHSSASVFLHKRSVSTGARPKELSESTRKIRSSSSQDFHGYSDLTHGKAYHFSPSLEPIFSQSTLSLFEGAAEEKDKRDLIVREFYSSEHQYVETLQMLVEINKELKKRLRFHKLSLSQKYMIPMKTQGILDSSLVDDIFYKVNEIYMHHVTFLTFLKKAVEDWNSQTTIGDVIFKNFSKQTVIENYVSFIENFPRAEKVLDEISTKSSFQKYIEVIERESKSKLPLKAQIVKPAQRIPRYELLLKRLLDYTPEEHPDCVLLKQAEGAIHALALKINSVKESKHEEDLHETVKKLELLLITDLAAPDRLYLRHDMVSVMQNRKDQHCVWLFTDLVVISSIKRKSGPINRKTSLLLQSPMGNDFVENMKHKLWMKVALDDLEIVKVDKDHNKRQLVDRDQLEADFILLSQISDLSNQLRCNHQQLDESIRELLSSVNKDLSEHQLKSPPPEANKVDLIATTTDGVTNITLVFPSQEKRASWESMFIDAKQKLSSITDGAPPEFMQALQITKTRAGMQFSCASPIEGVNASHQRDVWVCNSDGYVGHMCLLSLQPEPIVTLNTPVPGCNSRILCISAVPAFHGFRRRGSQRRQGVSHPAPPQIRIEESQDIEDGYVSDSSSSGSDQESADHHLRPDPSRSPSPEEVMKPLTPQSPLEPSMSSMWLGTEEGCILIFPSTENIKTTKCKIKIQQISGVLCITHMDQKVFASLANGDIVVYQRNQDGAWDISSPEVITLGTVSSPVTKMLAVAGKLWCACKQTISVINPITLDIETTFTACQEGKKGLQCMACSGQAVWVAAQSSSKVLLYHATTYQLLLDVNIANAVSQKLQTSDDIIRQHKTACLRITALLTCKELLWIGTSAGVVLSLPMPKITPTTTKSSVASPTPTGSMYGHTGHVRFLTSVELPTSPKPVTELNEELDRSPRSLAARRASVSAHTVSNAAKMLVISGGDGYEDFRGISPSDTAGKDDSTNHLLLWQV